MIYILNHGTRKDVMLVFMKKQSKYRRKLKNFKFITLHNYNNNTVSF